MNTITLNTKKVALAAVAAVCLAGTAVEAHAETAGDAAPTRIVRYADLDVHTQAGAAALYQRIRAAAEEVCGGYDRARIDQAAGVKACVRNAIAEGVRALNDERLTKEYNRQNGVQEKTVNVAALR